MNELWYPYNPYDWDNAWWWYNTGKFRTKAVRVHSFSMEYNTMSAWWDGVMQPKYGWRTTWGYDYWS